MKRTDGGPAFPITFKDFRGVECTVVGMSLWDHYVGQALCGLMTCPAPEMDDPGKQLAIAACVAADEVLAERERRIAERRAAIRAVPGQCPVCREMQDDLADHIQREHPGLGGNRLIRSDHW